jgi:hypothetical protein
MLAGSIEMGPATPRIADAGPTTEDPVVTGVVPAGGATVGSEVDVVAAPERPAGGAIVTTLVVSAFGVVTAFGVVPALEVLPVVTPHALGPDAGIPSTVAEVGDGDVSTVSVAIRGVAVATVSTPERLYVVLAAGLEPSVKLPGPRSPSVNTTPATTIVTVNSDAPRPRKSHLAGFDACMR